MKIPLHLALVWCVSVLLLGDLAHDALAATVVATYQFQNTFAADQGGVAALTATDPLGASVFVGDTVFGNPRTVWAFNGNATPNADQAGLTLDTTGLVSPTSYSLDMVFLFNQNPTLWRRILDVEDRQSDNGVYIDPPNRVDLYTSGPIESGWSNDVYHHLVIVNTGSLVSFYLDGSAPTVGSTSQLNINNANNPNDLMHFFLDNNTGSMVDYSSGRVASIRLWDGVLTDSEAQNLTLPAIVPEPSGIALATSGLLLCVLYGLRRRTLRAPLGC